MQVVLNKDVPKLGYKGDIVNVKSGYGRNYLLPKGLADLASDSRLKIAASRKERMVIQKQQLLDSAKDVIAKLKGLKLIMKAKVSEKGKLYAAITEKDVIDAIEEKKNVKLEKEFIKMEHFKEVGTYEVLVRLGEGFEEKITVKVQEKKK